MFSHSNKAIAYSLPQQSPARQELSCRHVRSVPVWQHFPAPTLVKLPTETIYSTYWPIYPDKRCLVLIVEDGAKTRVKVISDEFKKPAAKDR